MVIDIKGVKGVKELKELRQQSFGVVLIYKAFVLTP